MQLEQTSRNVFDTLPSEGHTFRNREVLSSTYIPEDFPHRNTEIDQVAHILRPALEGSRPSNILIYGQTGTGKTAVAQHIRRQLEAKVTLQGSAIHTAYINCKQVNTPYGILANIGQTYTPDWDDVITTSWGDATARNPNGEPELDWRLYAIWFNSGLRICFTHIGWLCAYLIYPD